jgi:phosphatidylserine/phosphatidylglycerophosphate/cardiolipin synthase-like enzyme
MAGGTTRSLFDELHSSFRDRWNELIGSERDRADGDDDGAFRLRHPVQSDPSHLASALFQSVGARMTPGHRVELVDNGRVFDVLVAEIAKARTSVNIVLYIWEEGVASDRVVAALEDRARHGVRCRVLVDAVGSPDFGASVGPKLAQIGCETRIFRPAVRSAGLARNHRKIVILDGSVALTGASGSATAGSVTGAAKARGATPACASRGPPSPTRSRPSPRTGRRPAARSCRSRTDRRWPRSAARTWRS